MPKLSIPKLSMPKLSMPKLSIPKLSKAQLGVIVAASMAVALVAGFALQNSEAPSAAPPDTATAPAKTQTPKQAAKKTKLSDNPLENPNPVGEVVLGADDAPVTIVEYSSLTCPHCGAFHVNTLPTLKKKYVDKGLVRFMFRPFPFNSFDTAGAMLVQCVTSKRRAAFLDILFQRQSIWTRSPNPQKSLQQLARQAGLSEDDFFVCLKDNSILEAIRGMQKAAAEKLDVRSTPTFFINGRKLEGNQPLSEFEKYIKPLLPASKGQ